MQANLWEITVQLGLFAAWGWFIGALVHIGKYRSLMAFDDPLGHTDTLKHSMYNGRDRESRDTVFGLTHTLLLTGSLQLCCQDAPCFFWFPLDEPSHQGRGHAQHQSQDVQAVLLQDWDAWRAQVSVPSSWRRCYWVVTSATQTGPRLIPGMQWGKHSSTN